MFIYVSIDTRRNTGRSTPLCMYVHSADIEDILHEIDEGKAQHGKRM